MFQVLQPKVITGLVSDFYRDIKHITTGVDITTGLITQFGFPTQDLETYKSLFAKYALFSFYYLNVISSLSELFTLSRSNVDEIVHLTHLSSLLYQEYFCHHVLSLFTHIYFDSTRFIVNPSFFNVLTAFLSSY